MEKDEFIEELNKKLHEISNRIEEGHPVKIEELSLICLHYNNALGFSGADEEFLVLFCPKPHFVRICVFVRENNGDKYRLMGRINSSVEKFEYLTQCIINNSMLMSLIPIGGAKDDNDQRYIC